MKKNIGFFAPGLYISNEYAAATKKLLIERNIRNLVNCGYPQSVSHYRDEDFFSYISVPLVGDEEEDALQYFKSVFNFVDTALTNGHSVLFYCRAGTTRSGLLAMTYLVHKYKCSAKEAYQHILNVFPKADVPFGYMQQLWAYELEWTGTSTIEGSQLSKIKILPQLQCFKHVPLRGIAPLLVDVVLDQHAKEIKHKIQEKLTKRDWKDILVIISNEYNMVVGDSDSEENTECENNLIGAFRNNERWQTCVRGGCYRYLRAQSRRLAGIISAYTGPVQSKSKILINMVEKETNLLLGACGSSEDVLFVIRNGLSHLFTEDPKSIGFLLARYIQQLGEEKDETLRSNEIDKLISLLQYAIHASDLNPFVTNALNDFARRIDTKAGREYNEFLAIKFKEHANGNKQLTKVSEQMREMLKDYDVGSNMVQYTTPDTNTLKLSVKSLNFATWPAKYVAGKELTGPFTDPNELSSAIPTALLPQDMNIAYREYYDYFKSTYPDRNLLLLPHMGHGEVSYMTKAGQTYTLVATTSQLVVLSLFNEFDSLDYKDISSNSRLPEALLILTLKSLLFKYPSCSGPILFCTDEANTLSKNILPASIFHLNAKLVSKTKRINILSVPKTNK